MRLSHKRKLTSKKFGFIPGTRRVYKVSPSRFSFTRLHPGEKLIFIGSARERKSRMFDEAVVRAFCEGSSQVVVSPPEVRSTIQQAVSRIAKSFRAGMAKRLPSLFNSPKRPSVTGHVKVKI